MTFNRLLQFFLLFSILFTFSSYDPHSLPLYPVDIIYASPNVYHRGRIPSALPFPFSVIPAALFSRSSLPALPSLFLFRCHCPWSRARGINRTAAAVVPLPTGRSHRNSHPEMQYHLLLHWRNEPHFLMEFCYTSMNWVTIFCTSLPCKYTGNR